MDDGWAVVIAGKPANERELDVYPKQKEAIEVARKIVRLPYKSDIGTKAIQSAVSAVIIERLPGR